MTHGDGDGRQDIPDGRSTPQEKSLPGGGFRRALRLIAWNALLLAAGLALTAAAAEAWLRLTKPFMGTTWPMHVVPDVGYIYLPDAEVRATNRLDFWTVSRTNAWGFLDREPMSPERAAASCHIAMIGDSFVQAREVPVAEKFHVRLEELAARELPRLDVTTSAFGRGGFGQVNQLPFYDEFARRLSPKLLVLVFVPNDFMDNHPLLNALDKGRPPGRLPWVSAERQEDGTIALRAPYPDPSYWLPRPPAPLHARAKGALTGRSWFAQWLEAKLGAVLPPDLDPRVIGSFGLLSRQPRHEALLEGWRPTTRRGLFETFGDENLPPVFEEALDFTAFALDQFKDRADRDGISLVILSVHSMRTRGHPAFDRLHAMAAAEGVPVIDQYDYILRQGADPGDAQWAHDSHWNAGGHRWAAEALLEYLKQNRDICGAPVETAERESRIGTERDPGAKRPSG